MSCASSNATGNSPSLNFTIQIDNPGSYTVWARGMAPNAGGDSLHVGINDGTPTTAANLTGFTPNQWSWSRLTMSNTNATLDLSIGGTFTLNVSMREDGLRLDKLMLVSKGVGVLVCRLLKLVDVKSAGEMQDWLEAV